MHLLYCKSRKFKHSYLKIHFKINITTKKDGCHGSFNVGFGASNVHFFGYSCYLQENLESKDSKTDMKTRKIEDNYQKKSEVKKIIFFTIKLKKAKMQLN